MQPSWEKFEILIFHVGDLLSFPLPSLPHYHVLQGKMARLSKELEASKELSTYEDVDIPQFSDEASKAANVDTEKNRSYYPVSRS